MITSGAITGDADSGLSTLKTYVAAANVIGADVTVNGVTLIGSGAGTSGTNWALSGIPSLFGSGGNKTTTFGASNIDTLFDGFQYGGNPGVVTFSGLTAGQTYVATLYNGNFAHPGTFNRTQTVTGNAGGASASYNPDAVEASVVRYSFVATGASHTLTFAQAGSGSLHVYGLSNEQVFNNAWSAGTAWSGATFSGGIPNGVGTNAQFPSGAIGSPTTVSVDVPVTLGHLQLDGGQAYTIGGPAALTLHTDAGGASVLSTPSGSHTVSAPLTLNSPLAKFGAGTLSLTGTIAGGAHGATVGDGTLRLASSSANLNALGPVAVDGATLEFANTGAQSYAGVISGNGTVTKTAAGTLTLSGASTYSGTTIFSGGVVNVTSLANFGANSPLGNRAADSAGPNVGLLFRGGTLQYTGSTPQTTDRAIRISTTGGAILDASGTGAGTMSFTAASSPNFFENPGARTLTLTGSNTGNNTFAMQIAQAGGQTTLNKTGAGRWLVTNNANSYTGETIIEGGILNVSSLSNYGVASAIGARTLAEENTSVTGVGLHFRGGTLQYTGSTPQSTDRHIRMLNGNGAIIDASGSVPSATLSFTRTGANMNLFDTGGARTLTLTGTNTGNNLFALTLENQAGNATSLLKTGTGTWDYSGLGTYTGATTVRQGTLVLSGARTAASGAITVADTTGQSATLNITAGSFTVGGNFAVAVGDSTVLGTVNQTGGSLTLSGNQLIVGNGTARGTYNLSNGALNGAASGTRGVILGTNSGSQGTFNLSGTGVLNLSGSNLQVARSENTAATGASGVFNQSGGTATVGTLSVGGLGSVNEAGNSGGMNFTGGSFTATGFNAFGGGNNSVAAISIGGTSVVTLPAFPTARGAGANTTVLFDGGTLRAGNTSATYMENLTSARITNNGMIFDSNGQTVTINQILENFPAHNGFLVKNGAGTLTLGGGAANTFSGDVTINDGTLTLAKSAGHAVQANIQIGNAVGSDALRLGASNQIPDTSVLTFTAGAASGNSAFLQMNGQSETVAGIQTSVGGRVPVIENAGAGTGILTVNNSANFTYDGIIRNSAGALGITKQGSGTLTLQNTTTVANISYTGPTTISGGTLRLELRDSGFASAVTNDATLELYRNAGNINFNPAVSGSGVLNKTGNGTVSLFGNSSYSGTTTIAAGRLRQQHASALGTGTVNIGAGNYTMLWWNTGSNSSPNPYVLNGLGATRDGELKSAIYADGGGGGFGSYTLTGPVTLAATSDVGGYFQNHLVLEGNISGPGGLTKDYLNILTLGGTGANAYLGTTVHKDGLMVLAKPAGVNAIPGNLTIGDGVVNGTYHHGDRVLLNASEQIANGAVVTINGPGAGLSGKLELNGFDETVAGIAATQNAAVIQVAESGTAGQNSTLTVNNAANHNFAGIIRNNSGGAAVLSLTKGGGGTLTLSGSGSNFYTGMTTVNAGVLELAKTSGAFAVGGNLTIGDGAGTDTVRWMAGGQVADNSVVGFQSGGVAQLNGFSDIIGALNGGAGIVDNQTATPVTLTLGGPFNAPNNAAGSFGGVIQQSGGGAVTLVKNGTGTQALSSVNSYTGKTLIQGGVLEITSGNEATLGSPAPAADALFFNGGTLRVSGANLTLNDPGRHITVGLGSGTVDVDAGRTLTIANPVFSSGVSLQRSGAGTLNLTATSTVSTFNILDGLVDIQGGTLVVDVVNVTGTGTFNWGNGRIEVLSKDSQNGTLDYSSPAYHPVRVGKSINFNGDLASDPGSVLALNRSPSLYLNAGVRFNNLVVNGDLNLSSSGDTLVLELSPYLLRPFSPALGSGALEYGSLALVEAVGGNISGQFDTLGSVSDDGLGFTPFLGPFVDAASLPVNTYFFEYADTNSDTFADTLFFHYKVAGYVPEPGTLSMMLAGFAALRIVRNRRRA